MVVEITEDQNWFVLSVYYVRLFLGPLVLMNKGNLDWFLLVIYKLSNFKNIKMFISFMSIE
jgi:hypothetical protein